MIDKRKIALVIVFIVFFSLLISIKLILKSNTLVSYNILPYTTAQTPNHNPVAVPDSVETEQDKPVEIQLKGSDEDGDTPLTFFIESYPQHGKLSGISENEDIPKIIDSDQIYTPDTGFTGHDEFEFYVDDSHTNSANAKISITVGSSASDNNAPIAEDLRVETQENTEVNVILEGGDVDPDDTITFQKESDPKHGNLVNFDQSSGTITYIPKDNFIGSDSFKFRTIDNHQKQSNIAKVSIKVLPNNLPPKADAGKDRYVIPGDEVNLDGSGSKDVDGTIETYFWEQVGNDPVVRLEDRDQANAKLYTADGSNLGNSLKLKLTVTDNKGATDQDFVNIVLSANKPIADAGPDQNYPNGTNVILDGTGSSSVNGDDSKLKYVWTSPEGLSLTDSKTPKPSFMIPLTAQVGTVFTFQLVVNDGNMGSELDTVEITVINKQSFWEKIWHLFRQLPTLYKIIVSSIGIILTVLLGYGIYKIIKRIMKPVITVVTKGGIVD